MKDQIDREPNVGLCIQHVHKRQPWWSALLDDCWIISIYDVWVMASDRATYNLGGLIPPSPHCTSNPKVYNLYINPLLNKNIFVYIHLIENFICTHVFPAHRHTKTPPTQKRPLRISSCQCLPLQKSWLHP